MSSGDNASVATGRLRVRLLDCTDEDEKSAPSGYGARTDGDGTLGMRSIAVVCVRILAVYLILSNLGLLTTFLSVIMMDMRDYRWTSLMSPTVMILLGVAALLFSRGLVALAFRGVSEPSSVMLDGERLLRVGTFLIGLFLVATALSPLVVAAIQFVAVGNVTGQSNLEMRLEQQDIVASFARAAGSVVVGLFLVGLSRRISGLQ